MHKATLVVLLLHFMWLTTSQSNRRSLTYVTALYDLGRGQVKFKPRPFTFYLQNLQKLLKTSANLVIFGEQQLQKFVYQRRNSNNTFFIRYPKEQIAKLWFTKKIWSRMQKVVNGNDKHQANAMKGQMYYQLQYYLPLTFCKMIWLAIVQQMNPFNTDTIYWIDAGITHVIPQHVFNHDNKYQPFSLWTQSLMVFRKVAWKSNFLSSGIDRYFMNYPIPLDNQILGGHFGGRTGPIATLNNALQLMLNVMIQTNYFPTQEILFSIVLHRYLLICNTGMVKTDPRYFHTILNPDVNYQPHLQRQLYHRFTIKNETQNRVKQFVSLWEEQLCLRRYQIIGRVLALVILLFLVVRIRWYWSDESIGLPPPTSKLHDEEDSILQP